MRRLPRILAEDGKKSARPVKGVAYTDRSRKTRPSQPSTSNRTRSMIIVLTLKSRLLRNNTTDSLPGMIVVQGGK